MNDVSCEWILQHIDSGEDVRLEGPAAAARLCELASRLEPDCSVIRVTAGSGGLSLSGLIGQLSGQESFDDQDDAALELGFRRLAGTDAPERRTVLLLDVVQGVQRPVLRYLLQVGRNAPRLSLVIAAGPELDDLLAEPGVARLRDRLGPSRWAERASEDACATGEMRFWAGSTAAATKLPTVAPPRPVLTLVPAPAIPVMTAVAIPADWTLDAGPIALARQGSRHRALSWTTAGIGMVASAVVGAWLGQSSVAHTGRVFAAISRLTVATAAPDELAPVPASPLSMPPPAEATELAPAPLSVEPLAPLAKPAAPAPALVTAPILAAATPWPALVSAPSLAKLAEAEPWTSWMPQPAESAAPEMAALAAVENVTPTVVEAQAVRHAPVHHRVAVARARLPEDSRFAAAAQIGGAARLEAQERAAAEARIATEERSIPNYGAEALPPDDALPPRAAYAFARRRAQGFRPVPNPGADEPFIGTFSTDPYGERVFRYGR